MSQSYDTCAKITGTAQVKLPNNAESPTEKSFKAILNVQLHTDVVINQKREEEPSSVEVPSRISARELNIAYGNDGRYWKFIPLNDDDSSFKEAAMLLQVNWFEITKKLEVGPFKAVNPKTYQILYIIKFLDDAFGWHSAPTKYTVEVTGEKKISKALPLNPYRQKPKVWHEVPGGQFTVSGNRVVSVEFGMSDTGSDWWKGGMVLAGIKIEPIPCLENEVWKSIPIS